MSLPNYMGCLMKFCKSLSLYYTNMCFKILNFFVRKSVFLISNLLYHVPEEKIAAQNADLGTFEQRDATLRYTSTLFYATCASLWSSTLAGQPTSSAIVVLMAMMASWFENQLQF
jgi:hypothetical protein